ncbi:MAG TPA: TRAP transporter small permease [Gammaproteobacteria bacterium]|nr:TRAP transporter small permease [Gammaproteobacteria bacterium]
MLRRFINRAEENIIAFLLVAMTLLVFLDVVMRFGWGSGFLWSQELTLYLAAWFVLFGISYGLKVGAHIGVDAFVSQLPPVPRRIVSMLAVLLALLYCGLFLFGSWVYLQKIYSIGISVEDMRLPGWLAGLFSEPVAEVLKLDLEDPLIPLWFAQSILLLGLVLFSIRLLDLLRRIITGQSTGFHHVDEAEESMQLVEELKGQHPGPQS